SSPKPSKNVKVSDIYTPSPEKSTNPAVFEEQLLSMLQTILGKLGDAKQEEKPAASDSGAVNCSDLKEKDPYAVLPHKQNVLDTLSNDKRASYECKALFEILEALQNDEVGEATAKINDRIRVLYEARFYGWSNVALRDGTERFFGIDRTKALPAANVWNHSKKRTYYHQRSASRKRSKSRNNQPKGGGC
ncbi:MAG: hypothetical protein AAGD96_32695, partial [Chloroflexota bacterium]